ncbi:alanine dehydrogenase [candidate division LCP-89 bacterium B3_LCP]|uniref:Alanine dehydrogenase n=1 Tax=candidate division LCP-89 bacterium B3_LCP TaxID=2012998 RepID=A0A532V394_UNCL8|nr:MAG: alanine dehydrogenase [candidate division LCP-89 bacterium B3_LCP]
MIIGVPKEIKANENRIALQPVGAEMLSQRGHQVLVEEDAGLGSDFSNDEYRHASAEILSTAEEVFSRADMIIKVKEPLASEYKLIKKDQVLFTYFHFAASKELTKAMIDSGAVCIAYETMESPDGSLPLLVPMSEVAGRMATQEGAKYLEEAQGGRGVLLGGVPGVAPGEAVVLGGGIVGTNAAKMAAGLGAHVTILDINLDRLRYLDDVMPANVDTLASNPANIRSSIAKADLLIGAVLIPGAKAPHLVTKGMLKLMKKGAVIVDVAVDQGGCIETCKPTTHSEPTYAIEGVVHYCVANMPGAVPHTSTIALTNATLPYAVEIADKGYVKAAGESCEILTGINVLKNKITYKGVADAFNLSYTPVEDVL